MSRSVPWIGPSRGSGGRVAFIVCRRSLNIGPVLLFENWATWLLVLVCLAGESDAGQGVVGDVFQPVAAALEGVDVGVVDDPVDHGRGDGLVAEHVTPTGEG